MLQGIKFLIEGASIIDKIPATVIIMLNVVKYEKRLVKNNLRFNGSFSIHPPLNGMLRVGGDPGIILSKLLLPNVATAARAAM